MAKTGPLGHLGVFLDESGSFSSCHDPKMRRWPTLVDTNRTLLGRARPFTYLHCPTRKRILPCLYAQNFRVECSLTFPARGLQERFDLCQYPYFSENVSGRDT